MKRQLRGEIDCKNLFGFLGDYISDQRECEIFQANCSFVSLDRKEVIFRQGTPVGNLVLIKQGLVKICRTINESKGIILTIRKDNEFLNLISMSDDFYNYSAVAMTPVTLCYIRGDYFRDLLQRNNMLAVWLLKDVSRESLFLLENLISRNHKQLPGKVADILLYFYYFFDEVAHFDFPLTRSELAQMAGTSKESLIRTLREFQKEDIIDVKLRKIEVRNLEALNRISRFG